MTVKVKDADGLKITVEFATEYKLRLAIAIFLFRLAVWVLKAEIEVSK